MAHFDYAAKGRWLLVGVGNSGHDALLGSELPATTL